MNAKNLIAAVAVFASGAVFAEPVAPYVDQTKFVGTKSRAEVVAEMKAAHAPATANAEYSEPAARVASGKTRAEVYAELEREYAAGNFVGNRPEYVEQNQFASTRSREEVRNEALLAARGLASSGN